MIKVRKDLTLINKPNIINLSKSTLYRDSLLPKDMTEIIRKINDSPLKIKDKALFNFFMKFFKEFQENITNENYVFNKIHFIFSTELSLPAYFNIGDKSFICNFTRPVSYLSPDDLVAHLLYAFIYKIQYISKQFKRKILLPIISDVYSSTILLLFGRKEGLLSDYNSLALLKLCTYKFVDEYLFETKNAKLEDYIHYLNKIIVRNFTFSKSQLKHYNSYVNSDSFNNYIESLRKLNVLQNVDIKIVISTIYRRFGVLPLTIYETADRILPFVSILNFPNNLNNNFAMLVNNNSIEAATKYVYLQYSSVY